jgi:hypothetical protein
LQTTETDWKDKMVEIKGKLQDVGNEVDRRVKDVERGTKQHPKTALGVAFLVGLAVGSMTALITAKVLEWQAEGET